MNDLLLTAIAIAAAAHNGQVDKAGFPYIRHPIAVMRAVASRLPDDVDAHVAAVLHDVIEDTDVNPRMLLDSGISARAVELVLVLTKKPGETYADFVERVIAAGPAAVTIKLCDVEHNLSRIGNLPLDLRAKLEPKYLAAREKLIAALGHHNAD